MNERHALATAHLSVHLFVQVFICLSLCIKVCTDLCICPWTAIKKSAGSHWTYPVNVLLKHNYDIIPYISGAYVQPPQHAPQQSRVGSTAWVHAQICTGLQAQWKVLREPMLVCLHLQIARAFRRKKMMAEVMSGGKGRQEILNRHADRCTSVQCAPLPAHQCIWRWALMLP